MALPVSNGLDLKSQRIVNLGDPSGAQDAATKTYVDNSLAGLAWKTSARVATTANGTLSTAFANGQTVDGVTLATNDRILIKNQSTGGENGIYVVNASGAPTRTTDSDTAGEILQAAIFVQEGTVNADTEWVLSTNAPITLGTTALTFVQFGAGSTYTAGNGLQLSSSTFSVLANGSSINVSASGVKLGTAAGGNGLTVSGTGVIDVGGGTGITVSADTIAIDTSVVTRKVSADIGNGSATSIAVTHNLGTKDVTVSLRQKSDDAIWMHDAVTTDTNTVTFNFATAPTSAQFRATVMG